MSDNIPVEAPVEAVTELEEAEETVVETPEEVVVETPADEVIE
jgi:hypothetical protein